MDQSSRLEEFYNKFNEDKRLLTRRGQVEMITTMKYIHHYLDQFENPKVIEIGAATGRYCVALANEGYDLTAVELTKTNLGRLKAKKSTVKAYQGNALDLSRFEDNSFDVTLMLGPMYHLNKDEELIQALSEAKRITKVGGILLVAYIMNEYAIIQHGFMDHHILESDDFVDENFHILSTSNNLYKYVRIEDINSYNEACGLTRIKLIGVDGPTEYMRPLINKMSEEEFNKFVEYHLSTCERYELLGANGHTLDILIKK